jgi:hypothetical protein
MTDENWMLELPLPADGSNTPEADAIIRAGIFIAESEVMVRRVRNKTKSLTYVLFIG